MLSKYLSQDSIHLQVPAMNWQEAVRACGDLLVKTGKCHPCYVDAMIQAVNDMGPYMVLAPGLALMHARPEDGTLQVGMSIVFPVHPCNFWFRSE